MINYKHSSPNKYTPINLANILLISGSCHILVLIPSQTAGSDDRFVVSNTGIFSLSLMTSLAISSQ